jgi:hypothetical protein
MQSLVIFRTRYMMFCSINHPFRGLPRTFEMLRHVELHQVPFGSHPASAIDAVFDRAPRLTSVVFAADISALVVNPALYSTNLEAARAILVRGAERLQSLRFKTARLCAFPNEAESDPVVHAPHLARYTNAGGGFARLAVDAPLTHADLEEVDYSKPEDWLVVRMGARSAGLRHLAWRLRARAFAESSLWFASRFAMLETLRLDLACGAAFYVPHIIRALHSLPPSLTRLALHVDHYADAKADWSSTTALSRLVKLKELDLHTTYAVQGFESACGLLGAPAGVERVTLGVANLTGEDDSEDGSDAESDGADTAMSEPLLNSRVEGMLADNPRLHATCINLPVTIVHQRLVVRHTAPLGPF